MKFLWTLNSLGIASTVSGAIKIWNLITSKLCKDTIQSISAEAFSSILITPCTRQSKNNLLWLIFKNICSWKMELTWYCCSFASRCFVIDLIKFLVPTAFIFSFSTSWARESTTEMNPSTISWNLVMSGILSYSFYQRINAQITNLIYLWEGDEIVSIGNCLVRQVW